MDGMPYRLVVCAQDTRPLGVPSGADWRESPPQGSGEGEGRLALASTNAETARIGVVMHVP